MEVRKSEEVIRTPLLEVETVLELSKSSGE
jgi:hypothetical protein